MLEQHNESKRKYGWIDKWAQMTGERAKIDAKANKTYIIYEKNHELVKEFPDGKVIPLERDGES